MRRLVIVLACALLLPAWKCSESDCDKAKAEVEKACAGQPQANECRLAKMAAELVCKPKPTPTPTPPPTPPPDDPTPPPTPPPPLSCTLSGEPPVAIPGHQMTLGAAVNEAMHALRPDCDIGGRCVIPASTRPQEWQSKVTAELRRRGFCAGQHTPGTDEIAVAGVAAGAVWEGFHVYVGGGWDHPEQGGTILWAPQAYRGAWQPPGSAGPTPPPPVTSACPSPQPPRIWTAETLPRGWGQDQIGRPRWMIACKTHGPVIDCTPKLPSHSCDYCASIGMGEIGGNIRCDCPVRPDGHPDRVACEDFLAGGKLVLESRNGAECERTAPTMFRPNGGNCRLCAPDKSVCGDWF